MKNQGGKLLALLALFLLLCLAPAAALAADLTVTMTGGGQPLQPVGDLYTIDTDGAKVTVAGTTTKERIKIEANGVTLTLDGASMELANCNGSPIEIAGGKKATIVLKEASTLSAYAAGPGIQVGGGAHLIIMGTGTLKVSGAKLSSFDVQPTGGGSIEVGTGGGYAGIGSANDVSNYDGTIEIMEGNITATGYGRGAGIGGGAKSPGGIIRISGGTVVAKSDGIKSAGWASDYAPQAAGIGGSRGCSGGTITISNSAKVTAEGGMDSPGIGGRGGSVTIMGEAEVKATGGRSGAGIGSANSGIIYIDGLANVTATGGAGACGIGEGAGSDAVSLFIGADTTIKAYSDGEKPAVKATAKSGSAALLNIYLADSIYLPSPLNAMEIPLNAAPETTIDNKSLKLPVGYEGIAIRSTQQSHNVMVPTKSMSMAADTDLYSNSDCTNKSIPTDTTYSGTVVYTPTAPASPTAITADITETVTPDVYNVDLKWVKPKTPLVDLCTITDYKVAQTLDSTPAGLTTTGSTATEHTFTNVNGNQVRYFWVQAVNQIGPGNVRGVAVIMPDTVSFSLDGANPNQLMGATTSMSYSLDGGQTYQLCQTNNMDLTDRLDELSVDNGIWVEMIQQYPYNYYTQPLVIDLTQAATPSLTPTQPQSPTDQGSIPMTTDHQYSDDGGTSWTDATGPTDLAQGTYLVRVRGRGTELASKPQSITLAYAPPSQPIPTYAVTVRGGSGGGYYPAGAMVTIRAQQPGAERRFSGWRVLSGEAALADPSAEETSFTMPFGPVEVEAVFEEIIHPVTAIEMIQGRAMAVGERLHMPLVLEPKGALAKHLSWQSSDPAVVKVEAGLLTALAPGSATITAASKSDAQVRATCLVTVTEAPLSGGNAVEALTVVKGKRLNLNKAVGATYSWTIDDKAIATVDEDGMLRGKKVGETTLRGVLGVKAKSALVGDALTIRVKVVKKAADIPQDETPALVLSPGSRSQEVGEKTTLTLAVTPPDADLGTLAWHSADPAVASVDTDGVITGVAPGETTITATWNDLTASCRLTVKPEGAQESLSLTVDLLAIAKGKTVKLKDLTGFVGSWTVDDPDIASIGESGVLKAKKKGAATLTFTVGEVTSKRASFMSKSLSAGDSVNISLFVVDKGKAVTKVTVKGADVIGVGETLKLSATVSPKKAEYKQLFWRSSDPEVAQVDEQGQVQGLKPGTATITATSTSGKAKSVKVTVADEVVELTLNAKKKTLKAGETFALTASHRPSSLPAPLLTWRSGKESVATVDESGLVTALKKGKATITATTASGVKATCKITVK